MSGDEMNNDSGYGTLPSTSSSITSTSSGDSVRDVQTPPPSIYWPSVRDNEAARYGIQNLSQALRDAFLEPGPSNREYRVPMPMVEVHDGLTYYAVYINDNDKREGRNNENQDDDDESDRFENAEEDCEEVEPEKRDEEEEQDMDESEKSSISSSTTGSSSRSSVRETSTSSSTTDSSSGSAMRDTSTSSSTSGSSSGSAMRDVCPTNNRTIMYDAFMEPGPSNQECRIPMPMHDGFMEPGPSNQECRFHKPMVQVHNGLTRYAIHISDHKKRGKKKDKKQKQDNGFGKCENSGVDWEGVESNVEPEKTDEMEAQDREG